MARLLTSGAEIGYATNVGGGAGPRPDGQLSALNGVITAQSAIVRSGSFAWKFDSTAGNLSAFISFYDSLATAFASGTTAFLRVYIQLAQIPTTDVDIITFGNSRARITSAGTLVLWNNNLSHQVGSPSSALSLNTWYRVELSLLFQSAANDTAELRLDGSTVATITEAFTTTLTSADFSIGWITAPGTSIVMYMDDLAINDSTGANQNTWPGDGKIVLLKPTADSAVGSGWTDSAASATGLSASVDNEPPTGIADTTANGGHQIRNASSATASYDAILTSYSAAGIGGADVIKVLTPLINTGAPVVTSAKTGSVGVVSNPTIANIAFVNGATAAANFWSGNAAGTFPTGWKWEKGTVTYNPSVTVGTAPVMRVTITGGTTTRIAMVDFMGVYVEYVPSGTAYTESATVATITTPSATDVAAYVESATISSITTPSALEIYTPSGIAYTDAATISTTSSVSAVEIAQFVDSATIVIHTTPLSSDISAYVDLNTVSTVSSVISSDVLAAIEAAMIATITTPISAELHEIFDSSIITGTTTPSSTELHEIPDFSSVTGKTTVTTLDTAQYVDASTTTTTTTPISTDTAQYVDAATTTTTTTPSTTDVVVVIDASTSTTITVIISSDVAAYVDAATLTTKTTVTSAELHEIPDSNTVSGTTFVTTLDTAQYVDANTTTAITTPSANEQQTGATSDVNTLKTTTSVIYTETAQYVDASTATSRTSISTTDAPIYGDSGTVTTTSTPASADVVIYVDAATTPTTTTPSAVEVGAFTDSATLTSLTSVSYVDAPIYGDSDSLLTTTTPSSADVATFTDFDTATTITSFSALETKTSGNTDFATVTTLTYIITVREGIFLLVDLIPSPLLARWYHTTTLTSRYPVLVLQKWATGLLTNRYNVNDYKKWVTSWIR